MRQLSAAATRPPSLSPHLYVALKRRWWPLFACLGAAGTCALALFGSSQQPTGTGSQQKPLAYSVARPDGSARTRRPVKPAGEHGPSESTHRLPTVPKNIGGEDLTMQPPETVMAHGRNAVAVPARGKCGEYASANQGACRAFDRQTLQTHPAIRGEEIPSPSRCQLLALWWLFVGMVRVQWQSQRGLVS
jgi:hypothetical protein